MRSIFTIALILVLCACHHSAGPSTLVPEAGANPVADEAFEAWSNRLIEEWLAQSPERAIYAGRYEHAHELTIPDAARRQADLGFYRAAMAALREFDYEALSPPYRADYRMLENRIESAIWYQEEFRGWQWMPSIYNVAGPFGLLLNTHYAPEDERLRTVLARLEHVPEYYVAARANIDTPTLEHTRLAVLQNRGALGIFGDELLGLFANSGLSDEDKRLSTERVEAARAAIETQVEWLEDLAAGLESERGARSFRLGEALYEPKFAYDIQSDFTARELYDRALAEKERLHEQMDEIALALWPRYFPETPAPEDRLTRIGRMIEHLSERHIAREGFIDEIKRQIPLIENFVYEHDLVDQDPSRPLVVRETPEYMRGGGAGASISAPGPFNPEAETYYNVTPLDDYTGEEAASYLREYNHWVLQILNIHEAIPGHYTQLLHANKSPSLVKSLFGNGAMIEGWAVYAERMMLEEGWGGQEPEMWLMYGKWHLRVVTNAILDYAVHVLGMGEEEALELLTREAFQERTEAANKWRRVTLSQVQLTSYFTGYAEIYDFREEMKARLGDDFDLKEFHNEFLSYGSAPVSVIKDLML